MNDPKNLSETVKSIFSHLTPQWKVFKINDWEWVVARGREEAHLWAKEQYGADQGDSEIEELTEDDLEKGKFITDMDLFDNHKPEQWKCECGAMGNDTDADWRWDGQFWEHHHSYPIGHVRAENIYRTTFRKELDRLVTEGLEKPQLFCSTEY